MISKTTLPVMPLQSFGLGDILFTQTLIREIAQGALIIWPVKDQFLSGLKYAYPNITFISDKVITASMFEIKSVTEVGGLKIIPIRFAEWIMGRQYREHMKSKYDLFEVDWKIWKRDAMPIRNYEKEHKLMKEIGIEEGETFNLIATKFGSEAQHEIKINQNNDLKNVEMKVIEGYDLFNWCGIIEAATNIHAVSSATLYLFELLNLSAKEVHLYPRLPIERDFKYVDFLFTKSYILH